MASELKIAVGVCTSVATVVLLCLFVITGTDRGPAASAEVEPHKQETAASRQVGEVFVDLPPSTPVLRRYAAKVFDNIHTDLENEKFTIVMSTYKRTGILHGVLKHYCKTPSLDKIIVIWNNVGIPVPASLLNISYSCEVPLKFIEEAENKLTNRFKPRPEIETQCK